MYLEMVVPTTVALPGRVEAVRSVGDRGGRTMVVSAKLGTHVKAHLDALGIEVSRRGRASYGHPARRLR